jgi:Helix-hairpin-helix motif
LRTRSSLAWPLLLLLALLVGQVARTRAPALPELPPSCPVRVLRVEEGGARLGCGGGDRRDGDLETAGGVSRMSGPALRLLGLPVDVNHGSVEDLEALPGIGPKLADRIVEARPFAVAADLQRVPGIGPKRWAQLQPAVTAVVSPMTARVRSRADHL